MRDTNRWRKLWFLGLIGLVPLAAPRLGFLRVFLLFFFAPLALDLVSWWTRIAEPQAEPPLYLPRLPPGPAERGGGARYYLGYALSAVLPLLNPFQLAQGVRQTIGGAIASRRVRGRAPTLDRYRQRVEYTLPFGGEWLVSNGGTTPQSSHSWELIGQRYAYDFLITDASGRTHRGDGSRKEDYLCYGEPILAPANGVVVGVRDGVRDAPWVGTGWVDWLCRSFGGNSVTIRHAEGEFSHLAHLIPGSIAVRPGHQVERGQRIGRCGNSGHSTEPHLHFQLQDHPNFFRAVGLPVAFSGCVVDGEPVREPTHLRGGMRVRHGS